MLPTYFFCIRACDVSHKNVLISRPDATPQDNFDIPASLHVHILIGMSVYRIRLKKNESPKS